MSMGRPTAARQKLLFHFGRGTGILQARAASGANLQVQYLTFSEIRPQLRSFY